VGGRRQLQMFPEHPAERLPIVGRLDAIYERIALELGRRRVVVLASGDPGFFGIGPLLAERFGRHRVEILPNVGCVALAFARLGESWQDATVVSAHGRPLADVVRWARGATKLAVLTDDVNTPAQIARALLEAGAEDGAVSVFEHLGGADERAFHGSLETVTTQEFGSLNVLVVSPLSWPPVDQSFGRPDDELAHDGGLITKAEVRAVALSKLRLRPGDTFWDVGAGCGSVAIEAAGLVPRGLVYAIERRGEQIELLRRNVAATGRGGLVTVLHGAAPAALDGLPDPDAVFVGGSGGSLVEILARCHGRLRPGGRLVVNLATVEHLAACLAWGRAVGARPEVVQVAVSRGTEILGFTRFEALNPVFVVAFGGGS
jgi:precorrin-6B C5,15-methyltransferase / cobalt-precorrin-6B C5,C15-methyltransferase